MTKTIDEAIEILTKEREDHHSYSTDIIGQAEHLGIEAMKAYKKAQAAGWFPPGYRLPGEKE